MLIKRKYNYQILVRYLLQRLKILKYLNCFQYVTILNSLIQNRNKKTSKIRPLIDHKLVRCSAGKTQIKSQNLS